MSVWFCWLFVCFPLFHPQTPPHVCVTWHPHILCVCLFCGHWTCLLKHTPPTGSTCFNNYLEMFCNLYLVCTVYTHCFYELNLLLISLFFEKKWLNNLISLVCIVNFYFKYLVFPFILSLKLICILIKNPSFLSEQIF